MGDTVLAVVPDTIEREILIDAPPGVVWSIVTEAQQVAGWFSDEAEIDLRPGGRMLLTWRRHGTYEGRVETVDPPLRFAFRWQTREGEFSETNSTLVVMTLQAESRRPGSASSSAASPRCRGPTTRAPATPTRTRGVGDRARRASRLCGPGGSRQPRPMTTSADEGDRLWAALGDPMRIRLLDLLLERGEATASTLAGALPITRQGVSKHLAVLDATVSSQTIGTAGKSSTPSARNASIRPAPPWPESQTVGHAPGDIKRMAERAAKSQEQGS